MPLDCNPERSAGVPCPADVDLWAEVVAKSLPAGWIWESASEPGTVMHSRVRVMAGLLADFHAKACALPLEFNCDTQVETTDSWWADYGLPDPCGIADLCGKVTFIGDGRCQSLLEIGASLGFDLCCETIPPEIQPGGWNLGCDQMPPKVEWLAGGSELGFMCLGSGPPDLGGSDLGVSSAGADDCNEAGYRDLGDAPTTTIGPCDLVGCERYFVPCLSEFTLCWAPFRHDYTGTAYHIKVGISGASPILAGFTEVGCWNLGCDEVCSPPINERHCVIERHVHAHVRAVPVYC